MSLRSRRISSPASECTSRSDANLSLQGWRLNICCAQGFQRRVDEDQEEADSRRLQTGVETQRHSVCLSANRDGRRGTLSLCTHSELELTNLTVVTDNAHVSVDCISSCRRSTVRRPAESLTLGCSTRAFSSCVAISAEKSFQLQLSEAETSRLYGVCRHYGRVRPLSQSVHDVRSHVSRRWCTEG